MIRKVITLLVGALSLFFFSAGAFAADIIGTTRTELSLWDFRKADSNEWTSVTLPHSCNAIDGQSASYYRGDAFYKKSVSLVKGRNYTLLFKSAAQAATISVNGKQILLHKGGYTPFSVNITPYIVNGENEILVKCNNEMDLEMPPVSSDFNKNNGLHDKVYLIESGNVYADTEIMGYRGIHVVQNDITRQKADVAVATRLISTKGNQSVNVDITISDASGNVIASSTEKVKVSSKGSDYSKDFSIANPHLWNGLKDPYLYNVSLKVSQGGKAIEDLSARVGLRYFNLDPEKGFFLNGESYPLHGMSYHQDTYGKASAVTEADIDRDFVIIKELGCNILRLAHYPHNEYTFDKCDEMGIVVQTEIPWVNECGDDPTRYSQENYRNNLKMAFKEMIRGHYNHPSIIFWGMWNEIGITHANRPQGPNVDKAFMLGTTKELYNLGKKDLDPTRLYGFADNGQLNSTPEWTRGEYYDYFAINAYNGWYAGANDPDNALWLNDQIPDARQKAGGVLCITEYGAGANPYCHSSDVKKTTQASTGGARHDEEWANILHEHAVRTFVRYPFLNFTTGWILFDFAVAQRLEGYIDSSDEITTTVNENKKYINDKGIVTRDRSLKKDTFYLYKSWWNKDETTVYISSRRFTTRPTKDIAIKVYSNAVSLALYQNGELVQTMTSSGEESGIIWEFAPVEFKTLCDVFEVVGTDSKGKRVSDCVSFSTSFPLGK